MKKKQNYSVLRQLFISSFFMAMLTPGTVLSEIYSYDYDDMGRLHLAQAVSGQHLSTTPLATEKP